MTTTRTKQVSVGSDKAWTFTFGVEIECTVPAGSVARGSYRRGETLNDALLPGWMVKSDSSIQPAPGMMGIEVVSPILRGVDGLAQIRSACQLLRSGGAKVNASCGLHIHVGAESVAGSNFDQVADWVRRLINHAAQQEPVLYGVTGTHRRERGSYCRSVKRGWTAKKEVLQKRGMKGEELQRQAFDFSRYQLLNIHPIFGRKTIEFRGFSGSVNGEKIVAWVQLALALCEGALNRDAKFDAPATTYRNTETAAGALRRWFYLSGWMRGRKDYGKPFCVAEGWLEPIENIGAARKLLMRLAKKYDAEA